MKQSNEEGQGNFSRRSFLQGALASVAGIAAVASAPSMANAGELSTNEPEPESVENLSSNGKQYPYKTYTADVVVIGSGIAGLMAARNALANGANVILVDKGPYGHSGASGINWGHDIISFETTPMKTIDVAMGPMLTNGMIDQDYFSAIVSACKDLQPLATVVKSGTVMENGTGHGRAMDMGILRTGEPVMPRFLAQMVRRSGVQILDRTMMLDILQDEDGRVGGLVGLDLMEGSGVVVRAGSVVLCPGSPCWCNGWSGTGAKTNASPENTGDGLAILLNHGVPIRNMEEWDLYFYNSHPSGVAFSQGVGIAKGDHPEDMLNSKGERFLLNDQAFVDGGMGDQNLYEILCMKEIYNGRGTSNGGLWYDITHIDEPDYMQTFNRRIPENLARAFNYKVPNPIEVVPTPWECAAVPWIGTDGQTKLKGLFYASAGDMTYAAGCGTYSMVGGHLAGENAAKLAKESGLPAVDMGYANEVLAKAFSALENESGNAIRPSTVMHTIQNIMSEYIWLGRTDEGLREGITQLYRVRDELMPDMVVPDKSTHFNQEWRQALEVPFMWDVVMGTAHAALFRTETRGSHQRLDYPETDNENWLKNVYVSVNDGKWSCEAHDIVGSLVPPPIVKGMITAGSLKD